MLHLGLTRPPGPTGRLAPSRRLDLRSLPRSPGAPVARRPHPHRRPPPPLSRPLQPSDDQRVVRLGFSVVEEVGEKLVVPGERQPQPRADHLCLAPPFEPPRALDIEQRAVTFAKCHGPTLPPRAGPWQGTYPREPVSGWQVRSRRLTSLSGLEVPPRPVPRPGSSTAEHLPCNQAI